MLNELWLKANELAKTLNTPSDELYITAIKIYIKLLESYVNRLKSDKRKKDLCDKESRIARRRRSSRFRRILTSF